MSPIPELIYQIDHATLSDERRRKWLLATTSTLGGIGLLATAYPFVASFAPSERARALGGPVYADISRLAQSELQTVAWRGMPVWLMRRSPDMVRALQQRNSDLADPQSMRSEQPTGCANATRSLRPEIFVALGVCTHLGCTPALRLDDSALNAELHAPGGFFCPCHGSRFDLAGRVVKNVPAPINLEIPYYRFTSATTLQIG
jgi:ubiquinol-cytochrome c reductase iron-sulfur subunit